MSGFNYPFRAGQGSPNQVALAEHIQAEITYHPYAYNRCPKCGVNGMNESYGAAVEGKRHSVCYNADANTLAVTCWCCGYTESCPPFDAAEEVAPDA
jgi:predicted nucleic-acid-binding Zn-ribbon protein